MSDINVIIMTLTSTCTSLPDAGYRITNPERFRMAARTAGTPIPDAPDEEVAAHLTTRIIREYTEMYAGADDFTRLSGAALETAGIWEDLGFEPPHDVQLLVEMLHRIHASG